jgi:hypothetical protein
MRKSAVLGSLALLLAGAVQSDDSSKPPKTSATLQSLQSEIESLRPAKVAWREIQWKSCLLDALAESRETKKPLLLWVFIDRPADDARC